MTLRTSSEVTTRWTPGTFFAALVSIDLMRPCATVLRKILACSMPGSRMRWVYSARPVTFSRASSLGRERPTCPPGMVVVIAINLALSLQHQSCRALDLLPPPRGGGGWLLVTDQYRQPLPPPLTPPHKGEGNTPSLSLAIASHIETHSCVHRRAHGARDIDAQELALVGSRAANVADR